MPEMVPYCFSPSRTMMEAPGSGAPPFSYTEPVIVHGVLRAALLASAFLTSIILLLSMRHSKPGRIEEMISETGALSTLTVTVLVASKSEVFQKNEQSVDFSIRARISLIGAFSLCTVALGTCAKAGKAPKRKADSSNAARPVFFCLIFAVLVLLIYFRQPRYPSLTGQDECRGCLKQLNEV